MLAPSDALSLCMACEKEASITFFAEANFSDTRDLIKYTDGLYYWAPDRITLLDADLFEANACHFGEVISDEDGDELDSALAACQPYKGEFLSAAADVSWCANLAVYYRTLYKRLCKTTIVALLEAGRLKEAQELCLRVTAFEPAAEEFSVPLMQSFIMDDDPTAALDHYQAIADHLADTYDIRPSANADNAQMVFERIVARFEEVFPRADVALKVSMVSLGALR